MAYKMFAAMYVGSSELALKIYEINGKKSFKMVDGISTFIELGKDTYNNGFLSTESINQICDVLNVSESGIERECNLFSVPRSICYFVLI